jgi:CheY-like chemotaxis protein
MTLEDQHHIFKHFTQLGNVYTRNTSLTGTGLGLAIVKKLVKLLGGKIRVKSQLNKGSTFYLTSAFTTLSPQDVPWLPYADRVKILGVQQQERDNTLHTLLANTFHDVVSADEALETVLATQTTLQPYDIVVFDPAALAGCRDLLSTLYQQADFKIPLLLGLTTEATPAAAHVNAMIAVNLENPNVKQFHQDLTLAWEGWLASANQSPRQAIQHPRVLLIEDNELIQIIHKHMLEDLGCKVDVSDTANHALQQLTQPYDMLFVDIGLPDIAGFDLIKKIRQQDNHLAEVPIIVLTGYSEESERDHCLQAGANEVAIKPVSKETLDSVLQRYVIR